MLRGTGSVSLGVWRGRGLQRWGAGRRGCLAPGVGAPAQYNKRKTRKIRNHKTTTTGEPPAVVSLRRGCGGQFSRRAKAAMIYAKGREGDGVAGRRRVAAERPPLPPMLWVLCVLIVYAQGIVLDFGVRVVETQQKEGRLEGPVRKRRETYIYTHTTNTQCFCCGPLTGLCSCLCFFLSFLSGPSPLSLASLFLARKGPRHPHKAADRHVLFFSNTQEVHPCVVLPNVAVVVLLLLLFKQKIRPLRSPFSSCPPPRPPHL